MITYDNYRIKIYFLTEVLGSQSTGEITTDYIAKKAGVEVPEDELDMLPEKLEKATTVFHKDKSGQPMMVAYQFKGFLKNAAQTMNGKYGLPKNFKNKVERMVFIQPRFIPYVLPEGGEVTFCERALRAQTPKGDRVCLARSEQLPIGTTVSFGISILPGEITESVLKDLLDYGYNQGVGQWRSADYGQFRYELIKEE